MYTIIQVEIAMNARTVQIVALGIQIDWGGFRRYLEEAGLSRKRVEDYVRYMRQGYWRLLLGEKTHALIVLRGLSPAKRAKVLAALGWLAEYVGLPDEWEERRAWLSRRLRQRGGRVSRGSEFEMLGDPGFLEEAVAAARSHPRPNYRLFMAFLLATGLRPGEAYTVWRHLPAPLIRHFGAVPGLRLFQDRGTKRAVISLLPEQLYESLLAAARLGVKPPSYARLRAYLRGRGLQPYDFRRANATALALAGAPRWAVDMLQGRAPRSVFEEHYNMADLEFIYEKWYRPALEPLVKRILEERLQEQPPW